MVENDALDRLLASGFPRESLALYGRWWALETWLRELVYTELRASFGLRWTDYIDERTVSRADRDEVNRYMASADRDDLLAYLDPSPLLKVIDENWDLFAPCLPPKERWQGIADELLAIRHRVAHVRRSHRDDLARLEQTLRDLDHGARVFCGAYAGSRRFELTGPVALGWRGHEHEVARRLIEHGQSQYDVSFKLRASTRPWASDARAEMGDAGALWHAEWIQTGDGETSPVALWEGLGNLRGPSGRDAQQLAMHVLWSTPGSVTATFAAVDEADAIADAIGEFFDVLLMQQRPRHDDPPSEPGSWAAWTGQNASLPGRVQVGSLLSMADTEMPFRVLEP